MSLMINTNAVRLLEYSLSHNPDLLDNSAFAVNAAVYSFLKNEFEKGDIRSNLLFQWSFSSFYGMGIVSSEAKEAFFRKMESLRDTYTGQNARSVAEDLRPAMGKSNFSFVTKMLNLISDSEYPIFDKNVAMVFQKPFDTDETRLDHQDSVYQDIIDTYKSLQHHPVIEDFRTRFCCPEMGYMKVLDTIFWKLGKDMEANYGMFPWE